MIDGTRTIWAEGREAPVRIDLSPMAGSMPSGASLVSVLNTKGFLASATVGDLVVADGVAWGALRGVVQPYLAGRGPAAWHRLTRALRGGAVPCAWGPIGDLVVGTDPILSVSTKEYRDLRSDKARGVAVVVPRGVDLARRSGEVAKLLFAGFGRWIYGRGYDGDDVLQEVYRGILVRNRGKCPWDPAKSSFGHYVHMVCGCILANYHRAQQRIRRAEVVTDMTTGPWTGSHSDREDRGNRGAPIHVDTGGAGLADSGDYITMADFTAHVTRPPRGGVPITVGEAKDREVALTVLPLVVAGYGRGEIAAMAGLGLPTVTRALKTLREAAGAWALSEFVAVSPPKIDPAMPPHADNSHPSIAPRA